MTERLLVVGGGAIGGVLAAHLAGGGHDVTVLDASQEHVQLLNSPGLILEDVDGAVTTVPLTAVSRVDELSGVFDYALLTLKSLALPVALAPLVAGSMVDTYVSLGNGLVQGLIESIVGRDRLVVGLVEWGATNLGPGHLRQTTLAPMVVGELDGSTTDRSERLRTILASVTPEARTSSTIMGTVWSKLLLNSTFSGLGAVGGCLYRDIATDPVGRQLALQLWTEGYDVATALDMPLVAVFGVAPHELVVRGPQDVSRAGEALDRFMVGAGATKASMLQDLERSVRTEVDVINGGVVSTALRLGRQAPLNAEVTRLVHGFEAGQGAPGPEGFVHLARLARNA
jgi:2-dehydropantoate 2-reductase